MNRSIIVCSSCKYNFRKHVPEGMIELCAQGYFLLHTHTVCACEKDAGHE